jgi:hypothetical protein
MGSTAFFLDLTGWASVLGPVFQQALAPATPLRIHRELAEKASECLEEGALLGDRANDGEVPWRALMVGDHCFLALEEGFALARFDASNLISLRLEGFDGRKWSLLHTGRGLAAFRLAALGRGSGAGVDPTMKIESFSSPRDFFRIEFHPDGSETDGPEQEQSHAGLSLGLAQPVVFGPELLGAGAVLMRRAIESLNTALAVPEAPAAAPVNFPESQPQPQPLLLLPPAHWRLVGVTGPLAGQSLPVTALAVLGRDPAADIYIENATVSRRHAELCPTDHGMVIKDLGSANGTWVAGMQLKEPALLMGGEKFVIGECAFRMERE